MESANGVLGDVGDKGGPPPPPSPLTGCYLLIIIGEPYNEQHKDIILQRIVKGLLSWDLNECLVDLEKELAIITEQNLEGEEARYGERLIQFASENLVTEILIHPAVSTLAQCMRNLLSSFTRHRHIIHAGYTFAGNGSWALQDGTFSYTDFSEAFQELEVQRVVRAYENGISMDVHCAPEGEWTRLPKEPFTKACKVRINPSDVLTSGSPALSGFVEYLSPFLIPTALENLLESSDVVGNIRFSRPTLYVFPGGQGDAALFGINGFNMLLDGGYSRKACFWDFVRHLDRLDAVLMTRLNNSNVGGISSVLRRKKQDALYPQIGHFFCNIQERKAILSPDGDKDKDPLLINLLDEGQEIISNLRHLHLNPQVCYRDSEPINLYHKVGHGTLDMYVLSPAKDSKEVREFLLKWNHSDQKLFANAKTSRDFSFPIQNLISISALLVWRPANPNDTITRILYTGSCPQNKILEGLDRLKNLDFIKHPTCSEKSLAPISTSKKTAKEAVFDKIIPKEKLVIEKKENKLIENEVNGVKLVKKSDSTESDKSTRAKKEEQKIIENGDKPKPKPKAQKPRSDSQQRKKPADKKSPTLPKKAVENGDAKKSLKQSPITTPAKSAKDANNRKVVENKARKEVAKVPPASEPKPKVEKVERKPISRRPPAKKAPISPAKKIVNGIQKPDSIGRKGKLDKEATTDSSTVSTPSADQESVLKKDISKLTPEELQQMKAQELAELKEEQEAIKEIEAVFRKGEVRKNDDETLRKVKDVSIDDKLDTEEYLIIEKEEIEQISLEEKDTKDENQKLARDSEESEKQRKSSKEEQEIQRHLNGATSEPEEPSKTKEEIQQSSKLTSPEEKVDISTDKKTADKDPEEEIKDVIESQPDEKVSANIKSGDTTTAPTLPEDERIPLDEIKEDNGVIEEKYVKEETKEKEVPTIQIPPKPFETVSKLPTVVGIRLDKQQHIRDIVKTPDEVADLPVHEEVDYEYTHELKVETPKSNEILEKKAEHEIEPETGISKEQAKEEEPEKDKDENEAKKVMQEELKTLTETVLKSESVLEKDILTESERKSSQDLNATREEKDKEDEGIDLEETLEAIQPKEETIRRKRSIEFDELESKEDLEITKEDVKDEKTDKPEKPSIEIMEKEALKEVRENKDNMKIIDDKLQHLKDNFHEPKSYTVEKEEIEDYLQKGIDRMEILTGTTVDKLELGRKSPKEREEDVMKIVAGVAEVLKSDAPLEEFEGKIPIATYTPPYTQELRETHITTVDSPTIEMKVINTDIPTIPEETHVAISSFLEEEKKIAVIHESPKETALTSEDKRNNLLKESQELMKATSKMLSDIKSAKSEETEEEKSKEEEPQTEPETVDEEVGTVHRMLVTASSEDGGEETEICPPGTIIFSKSSESSGRSSPDPSHRVSKSSIVDTISDTLSTVRQVGEIPSEKDSGIDDAEQEAQEKEPQTLDQELKKQHLENKEEIPVSGKSTPNNDASVKSIASGKSTPDISELEKSKQTSSEEDLKKDKKQKENEVEDDKVEIISRKESIHKEDADDETIAYDKKEDVDDVNKVSAELKDTTTVKLAEEVQEKKEADDTLKDSKEDSIQKKVDTADILLEKKEDIQDSITEKDTAIETKKEIETTIQKAEKTIEDLTIKTKDSPEATKETEQISEENGSEEKDHLKTDLAEKKIDVPKEETKDQLTKETDGAREQPSDVATFDSTHLAEKKDDLDGDIKDTKDKIDPTISDQGVDIIKDKITGKKEDLKTEKKDDALKIEEVKDALTKEASDTLKEIKDIFEKKDEKVLLVDKKDDLDAEEKDVIKKVDATEKTIPGDLIQQQDVEDIIKKVTTTINEAEDKTHEVSNVIEGEITQIKEELKTNLTDNLDDINNVSTEFVNDVKDQKEISVPIHESVKDITDDQKDKISTTIEKSIEELSSTVNDIKNDILEEEVNETKDYTVSSGKNMTDSIIETFETIKDDIVDDIHNIEDKITYKKEDIKDQIVDSTTEITDKKDLVLESDKKDEIADIHKDKIEETVEHSEHLVKDLKDINKDLTTSIFATTEGLKDKFATSIEETTAKIEESKEEITAISNKIVDSKDEIVESIKVEAAEKNKELKEELQGIKEIKDDLEAEKDKIVGEIVGESKDERVHSIKELTDDVTGEVSDKIADLQDEKDKVGASIDDKKVEISSKVHETKELIQGIKDLKDHATEAVSDKIADLQDKKDNIVDGISEKKIEIASVFEESKDALVHGIKEVKQEVDEKISDIQDEKEKIVDTISDTKVEIEEKVQESKEELIHDIKDIQTNITAAVSDKISDLQDEKEKIVDSINDTKLEFEGKVQESKEELIHDIKDIQTDKTAAVSDKISDLQDEKDKVIDSISDQKIKIEGTVQEAREELTDGIKDMKYDATVAVSDKIVEMHGEDKILNSICDETVEMGENIKESKAVLIQGIKDIKDNVTAIVTDKIADVQDEKEKIVDKIDEKKLEISSTIEESKEELVHDIKDIKENVVTVLSDKITDLQDKLVDITSDKKLEIEENIQETKEELIQSTKDKKDDVSDKIAYLQDKVDDSISKKEDDVTSKIQEFKEELKEDISSVKDKITDVKEEKDKLIDHISDKKVEIEEKVQEATEQLTKSIKDIKDDATEAVSNEIVDFQDKKDKIIDTIDNKVVEVTSNIEESKEHSTQSVKEIKEDITGTFTDKIADLHSEIDTIADSIKNKNDDIVTKAEESKKDFIGSIKDAGDNLTSKIIDTFTDLHDAKEEFIENIKDKKEETRTSGEELMQDTKDIKEDLATSVIDKITDMDHKKDEIIDSNKFIKEEIAASFTAGIPNLQDKSLIETSEDAKDKKHEIIDSLEEESVKVQHDAVEVSKDSKDHLKSTTDEILHIKDDIMDLKEETKEKITAVEDSIKHTLETELEDTPKDILEQTKFELTNIVNVDDMITKKEDDTTAELGKGIKDTKDNLQTKVDILDELTDEDITKKIHTGVESVKSVKDIDIKEELNEIKGEATALTDNKGDLKDGVKLATDSISQQKDILDKTVDELHLQKEDKLKETKEHVLEDISKSKDTTDIDDIKNIVKEDAKELETNIKIGINGVHDEVLESKKLVQDILKEKCDDLSKTKGEILKDLHDTKEEVKDLIHDKVEEKIDHIIETKDELKENADHLTEVILDTVQKKAEDLVEVKDGVKEDLEEIKSDIIDKKEEIQQNVQEKLDDVKAVKESLLETAQQVKQDVADNKQVIKDKLSETKDEAASKTAEALQTAKDETENVVKTIDKGISDTLDSIASFGKNLFSKTEKDDATKEQEKEEKSPSEKETMDEKHMKKEQFLQEAADEIEETFKTVINMTESVIFDKCSKPSEDDIPIDKEEVEKILQERTEDLEETFETVEQMSRDVSFEKCQSPLKKDYTDDEKTDKEKGLEHLTDRLEHTFETVEKMSQDISFQKCGAQTKPDSEKSSIDEIESKVTEKGEKETMEKEKSEHTLPKDHSATHKHTSDIPEELIQKTADICDNKQESSKTASLSVVDSSSKEVTEIKEQDNLLHEKQFPGGKTPPTAPASPNVKHTHLDSLIPETDKDKESDDEDDQYSITSQVAHSRDSSQADFEPIRNQDPMSMSFYGALPDVEPTDEISKEKVHDSPADKTDCKKSEDTSSSTQEHGEANKDPIQSWGKPLELPAPTYLYEITKAKYSTSSHRQFGGVEEEEEKQHASSSSSSLTGKMDMMTTSFYGHLPGDDDMDPIQSWGKPLGLPSPATQNDNKGTPKKERKLPANVTAKNKLNDDKKRAESPSKYNKNKKVNPVYVDLTYVPHHGNAYYAYVDFFRKVRARYYVFSGIEPSKEVYNALLEAKQTWEDKELEVTIIPTYDTDILGYWVAANEELLTKYKIDLSPSASRCTINLQDHETSCSAYRLEF